MRDKLMFYEVISWKICVKSVQKKSSNFVLKLFDNSQLRRPLEYIISITNSALAGF